MTIVLIVEDDPDVQEDLVRQFIRIGCTVLKADEVRTALEFAVAGDPEGNTAPPKIAIVDLGIPDRDSAHPKIAHRNNGLTLLSLLTEKRGDMPVIVLTASGDMEAESTSSGAINFLTKPFQMRDLVARFENLVRINSPSSAPIIDLRNRRITKSDGTPAGDIPPQCWALLQSYYDESNGELGAAVTERKLRMGIWGDGSSGGTGLYYLIRKIKIALEDEDFFTVLPGGRDRLYQTSYRIDKVLWKI